MLHCPELMNLVFFLLLIGPLVFVHELGHFLVAKAFGVRVLKFSLGFGPVMIGKRIGETYYQIAWIPLGGFVRFLGDDPTEELELDEKDRTRSWPAAARWKRGLIIFAGPAMSLIFPILCYFVVGLLRDELRSPTIGQVIPGTPAERAGLRAGDHIREIDGEKIYGFEDLQRIVSEQPEQDLEAVVERGDERLEVTLRPALVRRMKFRPLDITEDIGQIGVHLGYPMPIIAIPHDDGPAVEAGLEDFDLITKLGDQSVERWIQAQKILLEASPGDQLEVSYLRPEQSGWDFATVYVQQPRQTTLTVGDDGEEEGVHSGLELASLYIAQVVDDLPGDRAGLEVGDEIIAFDGQPIEIWEQLYDQINLAPEEPHQVTVRRGTAEETVTLEPQRYQKSDRYTGEREVYREPGIGIYRKHVLDEPVPNENRLARAAYDAWHDSIKMTGFIALGLLRMLQGRVSLQSIGGPIMLWDLAGVAGRRGTSSFLSMLAMISINLGLLNLLPIPVLDGGQLSLLGVEAIRRRPLTLKTREVINIVGLVLLLLLMLYALKNDIQRYWDWEDVVRLFR